MAGSIEKGLSSQDKMDKGYQPRTSGEGQRPNQPKGTSVSGTHNAGKFTIK